jgi:anti-anti-sigma factor
LDRYGRVPLAPRARPSYPFMSALDVTSRTVDLTGFSVTEDAEGGQPCLRLCGELDLAGVPELRARAWNACRRDGMAILDLSGIVFIDVAGLSALTALAHEARKGHWFLELRRPPLVVRQLARLTGLDPLPLAA